MLKDENGRLYKLLSERDEEILQLRKKTNEERKLLVGECLIFNSHCLQCTIMYSSECMSSSKVWTSDVTLYFFHAMTCMPTY